MTFPCGGKRGLEPYDLAVVPQSLSRLWHFSKDLLGDKTVWVLGADGAPGPGCDHIHKMSPPLGALQGCRLWEPTGEGSRQR